MHTSSEPSAALCSRLGSSVRCCRGSASRDEWRSFCWSANACLRLTMLPSISAAELEQHAPTSPYLTGCKFLPSCIALCLSLAPSLVALVQAEDAHLINSVW